jgi:hypothetical protein
MYSEGREERPLGAEVWGEEDGVRRERFTLHLLLYITGSSCGAADRAE